MKKLIYLTVLFFAFVSCSSDDMEPDYTAFLNLNTPGFIGNIDGSPFNFSFSWDNFNSSSNSAISDSSTLFNLSQNERVLTYSLSKQDLNIIYSPDFCNNNQTYGVIHGFDISSPKFNYVSGDIFNSALELGKKNIGNLENAFNLSFYFDSKKYCVSEDVEVIEILKTENIEDNETHYILVWLLLDNIVLENNEDGESINISNGKIIAKFRRFLN